MSDGQSPFHRGETEIQAGSALRTKCLFSTLGNLDRIPEQYLSFFAQLPLVAIGTVDDCGRAWASALTGTPGFARAIDPHTLEVAARPLYGDPLNKALVEGADVAITSLLRGRRCQGSYRPYPRRRRSLGFLSIIGQSTAVGRAGTDCRRADRPGLCRVSPNLTVRGGGSIALFPSTRRTSRAPAGQSSRSSISLACKPRCLDFAIVIV